MKTFLSVWAIASVISTAWIVFSQLTGLGDAFTRGWWAGAIVAGPLAVASYRWFKAGAR